MTVVPESVRGLVGGRKLPPVRVGQVEEVREGRREQAAARPAATVILLRDTPNGPEVYVLRRQATMAFASGQYVFPGGSVDQRDESIDVDWVGPGPDYWAKIFSASEPLAIALVCAAIRETFEESGVLLAGPDADTVVADTSGADWEADRVALVERELSFAEFLARRGLVLRADLVVPWAHWITPAFEPRRFDTRFLVAALPAGQVTREFGEEADQVEWVRPDAAIERFQTGEMAIMPPTLISLAEVAEFASVAEVMGAGPAREILPIEPHVVARGGDLFLVLPGDPDYRPPGS
ncbi:MAG TPA: NUDIX hydrolase [Sporichthya sp.]|nr:NUDIX hydrolase [Sporichthya sp.]